MSMHRMTEDIFKQKVWIGGYFIELVLVRYDEACNYVLSELVMTDGRRFSVCFDNSFSQWIYLACPEAFKMALVSTRWEHSNEQYLKASRIRFHKDRLQLEITVNLVLAACSGDGIRLETSVFQICFLELMCDI